MSIHSVQSSGLSTPESVSEKDKLQEREEVYGECLTFNPKSKGYTCTILFEKKPQPSRDSDYQPSVNP